MSILQSGNVKKIFTLCSKVKRRKVFNWPCPSRHFCESKYALSSNKLSYIHNLGEQPLKYQTIGSCLEESANKWPDRPWITSYHENKSLTFSQMLQQADKLASGLIESGLQIGDRIGICSPNTTQWVIAMMAAARAGLILATINPAYQGPELEYCLKTVQIKCLLIPSEFRKQKYYEMLVNILPAIVKSKPGSIKCDRLPSLSTIIMLDNKALPGVYTFDDMLGISSNEQAVIKLQKIIQPDNACNLQFTSGTTGKPKAACLSHFNFVNNGYMIGKRNHLSEKHHLICTQVPLFHAYGAVIILMGSLQHGATVVLPAPTHDPQESLKAIQSKKCTVLTGTPTMYVDLVNKRRSMNMELTYPEIAVVGGSPCSPELFKQMKNELNVKFVKSIYGLTETSASVFQSLRNENLYQTTETVGYVQEHVEVKVIDSNGNTVPFGTPGELCTRGYNNMLGYWNDHAKTNEIIDSAKWLKTGDQFILQEDGYGKIVGRLKDMIIRGGENIFPKEIEDFLNTHPGILESQVFGVDDKRLGEEICAAVRLKDNNNLNHDDLKEFCSGKIANFKVPRDIKPGSSYFHNNGKRPFEMSTIGATLERVANIWPDRPFIISETNMLTYSQLLEEADKFASGLLECGMKPGDRLGICAPNSTRWFIAMMAASRIGVITVSINPANTVKEIEHCLRTAEVKTLVIPSQFKTMNYYKTLTEIIPELSNSRLGELHYYKLPNLKNIIMMDDKALDGVVTFDSVLKMGGNHQKISSFQSLVNPESEFSILFTSGTTGLPKAATHTHFAYLNNSKEVGCRCEMDQQYHKICLQIPFFHAFALLMILGSLQFGSTIVVPFTKYDPSLSMNAIIKNKCTILTGTPTMYVDLIKQKRERNIDLIDTQIAVTGGAPCSPQLFNHMKTYLGVSVNKSLYGMTEACGIFQSIPHEDSDKSIETVGKLMDHLEAKVVDDNGIMVPYGIPGELLVRGYSNMMCYWGNPQKTSEIIDRDNWMRTGDQFLLYEDGYAKISGRLKDMIIRGGENVFPKEIEDHINTHPDVMETHVFAVKDDRLGEEICAGVRVRNGSSFDIEKLKQFCRGTLANFKIPKYLKIIDEFPKTTSGKVQKYKLREMMENGKL